MGRGQSGVRPRGKGIQIDFYYRGVRCLETIRMPPTPANMKFAMQKRTAILHEIATNTFEYAKHFPDSIPVKPNAIDDCWLPGEPLFLIFDADYGPLVRNLRRTRALLRRELRQTISPRRKRQIREQLEILAAAQFCFELVTEKSADAVLEAG